MIKEVDAAATSSATPQSRMLTDSSRVRLIRSANTPNGQGGQRPDQRRHGHEQADAGVADPQGRFELGGQGADRAHVGAAQGQDGGQEEDGLTPGRAAYGVGELLATPPHQTAERRGKGRDHDRGISTPVRELATSEVALPTGRSQAGSGRIAPSVGRGIDNNATVLGAELGRALDECVEDRHIDRESGGDLDDDEKFVLAVDDVLQSLLEQSQTRRVKRRR